MQQGGAGAVFFLGTEQRKKGNRSHHFLARAAHLPIPFSRTHFSLKIGMFYVAATAGYFYEIHTSGYLSVRCGILSTSYFRSRTGWVYHQIRIANIWISWIPRIFRPLFSFQPFFPGNKDWHFSLYDYFGHCVQNNVSGSNGSNQKELKQNKISEMDGVYHHFNFNRATFEI